MEGETARTILNTVPEVSSTSSTLHHSAPLQVRSLSTGENDPLIQVLLFDPHQLITHLTKCVELNNHSFRGFDNNRTLFCCRMEKMSRDVPKKKVMMEADALRSYIYARRHFGSGKW